MKRRALAVSIAALALGCAAFDGLRERPPMIAVDWLGGFPKAPPAEGQTLELLLDVSAPQQPAEHGLTRFEAVRLAALRLVDDLPETASVGLSVLGARDDACRAPESLADREAGASRTELRRRIRSLEPAGAGSLPMALEILASSDRPRRVVAFSDLDSACGGDLCAAASALVDSGARLDLVVVGDAEPPACLADLEYDVNAPPADAIVPVFRVETPGEGAPQRIAEGYADGRPVPVRGAAAGLLVVDSDPPIRIGPIHFTPATITRVQVLDFPRLEEPVREWRTSTETVEPAEEAL